MVYIQGIELCMSKVDNIPFDILLSVDELLSSISDLFLWRWTLLESVIRIFLYGSLAELFPDNNEF